MLWAGQQVSSSSKDKVHHEVRLCGVQTHDQQLGGSHPAVGTRFTGQFSSSLQVLCQTGHNTCRQRLPSGVPSGAVRGCAQWTRLSGSQSQSAMASQGEPRAHILNLKLHPVQSRPEGSAGKWSPQ